MDYRTFTTARELLLAALHHGALDDAERTAHLEAFKAKSLHDQVVVLEGIKGLPKTDIAWLVATFRATLGVDATPEARAATRTALQLPTPIPPPWTVSNALHIQSRPDLLELSVACNQAARTINFKQTRNPAAVVAEVLHHLKIGGIQDLFHDNPFYAVDPQKHLISPTAHNIYLVTMTQLEVQRPNWFKDGLLRESLDVGELIASVRDVEDEEEQKKREKRNQDSRERAEQKRLEIVGYMNTAYAAAVPLLDRDAAAIMAALRPLDFVSLRNLFGAESWPSAEVKALAATLETRIDASKLGNVAEAVLQITLRYIHSTLAKAQPTWFRSMVNGDFQIRKEPKKEVVGLDGHPVLDRKNRSARLGLIRIIGAAGRDAVVKQLAALCGIDAGVLGSLIPANINLPPKPKPAPAAAPAAPAAPPAPPAAPAVPPGGSMAMATPPAPPAPPAPPTPPAAPLSGALG